MAALLALCSIGVPLLLCVPRFALCLGAAVRVGSGSGGGGVR